MERARTSKPQFADVYREFELLHGQVKKMAQHHPAGQPLEVHNIEVCGHVYMYMQGEGMGKWGVFV